jgi:hypothetical protein
MRKGLRACQRTVLIAGDGATSPRLRRRPGVVSYNNEDTNGSGSVRRTVGRSIMCTICAHVLGHGVGIGQVCPSRAAGKGGSLSERTPYGRKAGALGCQERGNSVSMT